MALQRHERAVQSMALWQDSVFTGSEDTEIKVTCSSCVVLLYKICSFEPKLFIPRKKKIETKIWNRKPGFKAIKYVCSLLLVTLGLIKIGILCATVLISMYEIELEFLLLGYMLFSHYSLCYFTGLPAFQAIVTQNDCVSNCGCTCI